MTRTWLVCLVLALPAPLSPQAGGAATELASTRRELKSEPDDSLRGHVLLTHQNGHGFHPRSRGRH